MRNLDMPQPFFVSIDTNNGVLCSKKVLVGISAANGLCVCLSLKSIAHNRIYFFFLRMHKLYSYPAFDFLFFLIFFCCVGVVVDFTTSTDYSLLFLKELSPRQYAKYYQLALSISRRLPLMHPIPNHAN